MSMWTLMHVNGCGGPAVKRTSRPEPDEPFVFEINGLFHVDGSPVKEDDPMICDSCRRPIWPLLDGYDRDHWVQGEPQA